MRCRNVLAGTRVGIDLAFARGDAKPNPVLLDEAAGIQLSKLRERDMRRSLYRRGLGLAGEQNLELACMWPRLSALGAS